MNSSREPEVMITKDGEAPKGPQNAKERIYEKLRMPLWLLDTILVVLAVALVACLVIGGLKGNGLM